MILVMPWLNTMIKNIKTKGVAFKNGNCTRFLFDEVVAWSDQTCVETNKNGFIDEMLV